MMILLAAAAVLSSAHVNVSTRTYVISQQPEDAVHSKAFILLNFHPTVKYGRSFSKALQVASKDFILLNNATSFVPYCTALQLASKAFILVGKATHTKQHCTALQLQSKDFVLIENSTDYAPYCTALQVQSKDFVLVGGVQSTAVQLQSQDLV